MHRFFIEEKLDGAAVYLRNQAVLNQWRKVLRLKEGSQVELVSPTGIEAVARIDKLDKDAAELTIVSSRQNDREPARNVTLYCAMLKRENFEWVAQKAVEVGVSRLVPVMTERTVKLGFKRERLEAIMREAAEQSGRGLIPVLSDPLSFIEAIADSADIGRRYFFDADGQPFAATSNQDQSAAAFIGPEGGWDEAERAQAKQQGLISSSLGPRILRAETAAVVASYLLCR